MSLPPTGPVAAPRGPGGRRWMLLLAFGLPAAVAVLTLTRAHDLGTSPVVLGVVGAGTTTAPASPAAATTWPDVPIGQTRCLALVTVSNTGADPVNLQTVTFRGEDGAELPAGVRLGPAQVVAGAAAVPAGATTCPPGAPAAGYVLRADGSSGGSAAPAAPGGTLTVPVTITAAGSHRIGAVVVRYQVAGRSRVAERDLDVRVCSGAC